MCQKRGSALARPGEKSATHLTLARRKGTVQGLWLSTVDVTTTRVVVVASDESRGPSFLRTSRGAAGWEPWSQRIELAQLRTTGFSEKDALIMLVLSRKSNESIVINNNITVTVVEIRGDKVRLGIVAPKEIPVHRQEVYEQIVGQSGKTAAPA